MVRPAGGGSQRRRALLLVRGGGGAAVGRGGTGIGPGLGPGLGQDGHGLGGIVGVEDDAQALVGVGRVAGDRGDDDDLLLGGGEDVAQALGDAGADLAEGGLAAPAVEAAGLLGIGLGGLAVTAAGGRALTFVFVADASMVSSVVGGGRSAV
jgi:hypothetical protein